MSVTREEQLVNAFIEAADTLVDDFDVIEFLHALAGHCVQLLEVDAAGVMLADHRGVLHASTSSSENAHVLELVQLQAGAGPCLEAFRTGVPVVNTALADNRERWPRFAEAAGATGFLTVHALPLRLHGTVIGAVDLFCSGTGALSDHDIHVGQALADVATMGILAQRAIRRSEALAVQLRNAMNSRVSIEQAKGMLAERLQITTDAAFTRLRAHARSHNLPLSDLARQIADGSADIPDTELADSPPAEDPPPLEASR